MSKKLFTFVLFQMFAASWVVAAPGPGVVRYYDDGLTVLDVGRPVTGGAGATFSLPDLQLAADHLVSQQCPNGGWGWPHADCGATYNNITGPIAEGLLSAYSMTGDAAHLAAAVDAGAFDMAFQYGGGEARFGGAAPHFLWRLSLVTGDNQYMNHAATGFFDALDAGTYGDADLDTAEWIAAVQAGRTGTWVNLRPWEFSTIIPTAAAIGNAGQAAAFEAALLDGLNTLNNTSPNTIYSDILGLAGGVRGLALNGTTSFPAINSPNHPIINGINNLQDLADALRALQNPNGSWYWHSNLGAPANYDEDTQTTAYAVLALVEADPLVGSSYSAAIKNGSFWLTSMQLGSGGFMGWPGGDENTEVEGEAMMAIVAAGAPTIPTLSEWGLVVLTLAGLVFGTIAFTRSRQSKVTA